MERVKIRKRISPAFSSEELGVSQFRAEQLACKGGYFRVQHTHKNGRVELCRVTPPLDQDGQPDWTLVSYSVESGSSHLAVVAGSVLPRVRVVLHGRQKNLKKSRLVKK